MESMSEVMEIEEDIISRLPDDILCHILSFLPTQNAIATTILSKRWRCLCFSLSTLNFDDQTYLINNKPYSSFKQFVHTTILQRHLITTFRLKSVASQFQLSDSDLNEWLDTVMQRGLQILHIDLRHPYPMLSLGFTVFSSRTLVVLKLHGWLCLDTSIIDFPSLKTLLFDRVDFIEPHNLIMFLRGCPNLEVFEAHNIEYLFHNDSSYDGGHFTLPKLIRADISNFELGFPLKPICNAHFLRIHKCAGVIPVFPNLTHLELVFEDDINWQFVLAMLEKCLKLQNLVLCKLKHLETVDDMDCSYPASVPQCHSSHLKECAVTNCKCTENEVQFAKHVMESSTSLETMTIRTLPYSNPQ